MAHPVVLSLDEGTSGATAVAVGMDGEVRGKGYEEITQHYPRPGWVEHDPNEIWSAVQASAKLALEAAGAGARDVRAVGITNQRETLVLWDRDTLEPIAPAIVWQDRRTADECARLRAAGHEPRVRDVTGLVLDPYFTATKLAWALKNIDGASDAAVGTVDSWLIARLSGGADHVTDASNASRTLLFDIGLGAWSEEMAELFGVSLRNLPRVVDSCGRISSAQSLGGIMAPIAGVAGDQQAALFGQACTTNGMAKNTYGTGSFVLMQTGSHRVISASGMLTTVAWRREGGLSYALEGAIFVTGAALQWLRDGLGIISSAAEAGPLASSVPDAGGVFLVPAFVGLGAPYWDPYARGTLVGLTRGSTRAHIVRAAVEAMAYQTRDVVEAMQHDTGQPLKELRVDGGAAVMDVLCQLQADLLGIPVRRPRQTETTALGAAFLAGLGAGVWSDADLAQLWKLDREFEPRMSRDQADAMQSRWRRAVERSRAWELPE
ncbi:MAG: glycerol kinase GlpK [Chloroflexi bacterium]|nr:MAG: glycerol kinase GlpK [Chloroflexota bacterium]TME42539.1 MAG: glycerol kinase GlpK [Chloroflexota bacterium]